MFGLKAFLQNGARAFDHLERSGLHTSDQESRVGLSCGLAAGTRVVAAQGWRSVEGIIAGDRVLTFDSGMQTVKSVERGRLLSGTKDFARHFWPVRVPAGALDNAIEMVLLPQQAVMIEHDAIEAAYGDPFALVPARALVGFRSIAQFAPTETVETFHIRFENDQVVFVDQGALCLCPSAGIDQFLSLDTSRPEYTYRPLRLQEARALIARIDEGCAPQQGAAQPCMYQAALLDVSPNRP